MIHRCFCATLADHLDIPEVARALDRLRDEVTVAACRVTGLGDCPPEEIPVRGEDRRRAMVALGFGPLTLKELILEVYPRPVDDPDETYLRTHRVRAMLRRLIDTGRVERIGWGVYQLRGWGPREQRAATIADCRRILADPRVLPPQGLTVRELAERLDMPIGTIRTWLQRLRDRGTPIAITPADPGRGTAGGYRYRVAAA